MRFNPFYEREASVMSRALSLKAEKDVSAFCSTTSRSLFNNGVYL